MKASRNVVDLAVDPGGAQARAALARRAEAGEQGTLHREVDVCVGHDDQRVLSAELEARALQMTAGQLADRATDRRRPREPHLLDQAFVEGQLEPLERRRAVSEDELEHSLGDAAVTEQLEHRLGDRGRGLSRLPHDSVPAQQRRDEVPGRDGRREVRRRDDRGHAYRDPEREQLLVGHLARHGLPVEPATLAQEEVAGVDDLLHLTEGLGVRLADLTGHEGGQRLLVRLDEPPHLRDDPAADRCRHLGPRTLRLLRPPARSDERGAVRELDLCHDV